MGMPKPSVRRAPPSATENEAATVAETKATKSQTAEAASEELTQAVQSIQDSGVSSSAFIPALDDEGGTRTLPAVPPSKQEVVPAKPQSSRAMAVADAEDDEFDNLGQEVGFGSFPIVKLDKAELVCADLNVTAKSIDGVIMKGRRKYLYKASREQDEERLAYSYHDTDTDGNILTADGRKLIDVIAEWKEDGKVDVVRSRYYECMLHVLDVECEKKSATEDARAALVGELVLTSIAPSSVQRLAGFQQKLKLKKGQPKLRDVVTRLSAGSKITPKKNPANTYFPWDFKLLGLAPSDIGSIDIAEYKASDL